MCTEKLDNGYIASVVTLDVTKQQNHFRIAPKSYVYKKS